MEKLESALTMMKKSKSKKSVNFCEMATVRTFDQPQSALLNRGKQINGMDCSSASATPVRSSVPVAVPGASLATTRAVVPAKAKAADVDDVANVPVSIKR